MFQSALVARGTRSAGSSELLALNINFGTLTLDAEGKVQRANQRLLTLLGMRDGEVIGRRWTDFVTEATARQRLRGVWRSLRRLNTHACVVPVRSGSADTRLLSLIFTPISDDDARLTSIVIIATDVTDESHRAHADRAGMQAVMSSSCVLRLDLDGRIVDVNQRLLQLTGHRREALTGRHYLREAFGPAPDGCDDSDDSDEKALWQRVLDGNGATRTLRRRSSDGRSIWFHATYALVCDANGRASSVMECSTDITAERLRLADFQWQVAAIHKSHAVVTFDPHGAVLQANQQFLDALGYRLDDILGRHHRVFVDASYACSLEYQTFWNDLKSGMHKSGEYGRVARDGSRIWLQATYNPIFDTDGGLVKIVKYATVVTDTKQQQAEHQGQIAAIHRSQAVIAFDLEGRILDANENFLQTMGYRFAEVRGQHHRMFLVEDDAQDANYQRFWNELAQGKFHAAEYKRRAKGGREVWLQASYNPIFDSTGRPFKVVKYAVDITVEKLRNADHSGQIEALTKSQGVLTLGLDGYIRDANPLFLQMFGYRLDELKNQHHSVLVDRQQATSAEYFQFWETLRNGTHSAGLFQRIDKLGEPRWIQATYNPILDLNGKPIKIVKIATDVTSNILLAEAFNDARRQAQHDSATALPNRTRLLSFMTENLNDESHRLAVFYMDLDRFKWINDSHGHHAGDYVLGEVADRLRRTLRDDQLVARIGGDEFVAACPDLADAEIEALCERLVEAVSRPMSFEGNEFSLSISIGVSVSPADGQSPDELLRHADAAMYRAKEDGRNGFRYYSAALNSRHVAMRQLIADMRRSISNGDFVLEFQPRFDTQTQVLQSAEALVRWNHPERGRLNPADFIEVAERSGLIVPLGEWILRAACQFAARAELPAISVNVSPVQFHGGDIVASVRDALQLSGLPPRRLEIEITEGVLIDDADGAKRALDQLKALGVKIAIDDFGTGYSSLSYLRNFPFDVLKIDRKFISDLEPGSSGREIVRAIIGLGKALGLTVTAEGVETIEQLTILADDRCEQVQGFLLSRPLPPSRIPALIKAGAAALPAAASPFESIAEPQPASLLQASPAQV